MAQKQYPDIAAARHMKSAPSRPDKGPARGKRVHSPAEAPRPVPASRSKMDPAYRKKRLVALLVTNLVCLTVPALIVLLVLFG